MADRYWVGGTGTWNTTSTTNWSATSGGAGGASVPTVADSVFFDQASTYTVTMTGALACLDINVTGGTVTFQNGTTPTLNVRGSISFIAGTIWNTTGLITCSAIDARTITTNGVLVNSPITFNGTGGTWTLQDNLTLASTRTTTLTTGTLALGSFILTTGVFNSSGSSARTINFGTGKIVLNRSATDTIWTTATVTNLTVTGTSLVECIGGGTAVTKTINTGALSEANSINFSFLETTGTVTYTFTAGNSFRNLNITGPGSGATTTFSNIAINIFGSFTHTAGVGTVAFTAGTNAWTFAATSGSYNITNIAGFTYDFPWTFGSATSSATWTLVNNLTLGATRQLTLTNGTTDFNSKTLSAAGITILTGTPTIANTGTASFTITLPITHTSGSFTLPFDFTTSSASGYTFTAGTLALSSFTLTTPAFSSSGTGVRTLNFNTGKIVLNGGSGVTIWNTSTATNMTISGTSLVECVSSGLGTRTINAGAPGQANTVNFSLLGVRVGISADPTFAFTASNNIKNLIVNGNQTISNIAINIFGSFTHLTTSGTTTFTAGTNAWTFAATSDSYNINNIAAFTYDFPWTFGSAASTATWTIQNNLVIGSAATRQVTLTNGTVDFNNKTLTGNFGITVLTGTATLNSTGASTFSVAGAVTHTSGTLNLGVNFTTTAATGYTLTAGTLSLGTYTLTTTVFTSSGTGVRTLAFGTGQLALTGNAATIFNVTTATNFSTTGTVYINSVPTISNAGTRTFVTGFTEAQAAGYDVKTSGASGIVIGTTPTDTVAFTGNFNNFDLTGFTNTLSNTARTIYGNFTVPNSGGALTAGTSATTFSGSGTQLITTNSRTLNFPFTFNGTGTFRFVDSLTLTAAVATNIFTLTAGTLDLNNNTITAYAFSSSSSSNRSIEFGTTGQITLNGNSATIWNTTTGTNFTWTGTPKLFASNPGSAGTRIFAFGTIAEAYTFNVKFAGTAQSNAFTIATSTDIVSITGNIKDFDFTNSTNVLAVADRTVYGNFTVPASGGTINATGTSGGLPSNFTTFAGNSGTSVITTNGRTIGIAFDFNGSGKTFQIAGATTLTSGVFLTAGTIDLNNFNFTALMLRSTSSSTRSILFGTSGQFTLTNGAVTAGATVFVFTNGTNFTWTGTHRLYATYSGGTSDRSFSFINFAEEYTFNIKFNATAQANAFTINTSTDSVTITGDINDFDFTGSTNTLSSATRNVYGNFTIPATGGTIANSLTTTFKGSSGTRTFTTNNRTPLPIPFDFNGAGRTWQQTSATTLTTPLNLTAGTLDLNNLTFTSTTFVSSGTSVRSILFGSTGQLSLTAGATSATIVDISTGTNFSWTGTPKIVSTYAGATATTRTFTIGNTAAIDSTYAFDVIVGTGTGINLSATATDSVALTGIFNSVDLRGLSGTLTNTARSIAGSFRTSLTGGTYTAGTTATTFIGNTSTHTIDTATRALDFPFTFDGSATWTIANTFTCGSSATVSTKTLTLTSGNVSFNGVQINCGLFSSTNTNNRNLDFGANGKILLLSSTSSTLWNTTIGTNFTWTGNFDVDCNFTGAVTKTISFGTIAEPYAPNVQVATAGSGFGLNTTSATESVALSGNIGNLDLTNFAGTLTNLARNVYGNLTFPVSGGTFTGGTAVTTLAATSGTELITYNGRTIPFPLTINGTGGTFVANGNILLAAANTLTLTNGHFNANLANITASTITISTGNAAVSNLSTTLTVTHTSGDLNLNSNVSTGIYTLTAGNLNLNSYIITTPTFSSSGSGNRAINFGTGSILISNTVGGVIWNTGTVTNLTTSGSDNVIISNSGSVATTITPGSLSESNSINFIFNTGTYAATITAGSVKNLNFTGFSGSLLNTVTTVYGDLLISTGMSLTAGASAITFANTSSQNITSNGKTFDFPITFNGVTGTVNLLDNLTVGNTRTTTLTSGTLNLNDYTLNTGLFSSSNSNDREIDFANTGKIQLTASTAVTYWNMATITGFSHVGNSNIETLGSGAVTKTINTGGANESQSLNWTIKDTAGNVAFTSTNRVKNLTLNGSFTLSNIPITIFGDYTYTSATALTAGTNAWTFDGSAVSYINGGGVTHDFPWTIIKDTDLILQSATTIGSTRTTSYKKGTFDLNGYNYTTGLFDIGYSGESGLPASTLFGGSPQYLTVSGIPIQSSGEFTFETWVNILNENADGGWIYTQRTGASAERFGIFVRTTVSPIEIVVSYSGNSYASTGSLNFNTWYHYAVTRDSSNTLRVFVNGVLVATESNFTGTIQQTNATIGRWPDAQSQYLNGYLSDLRVVRRALYTSNFTPLTLPLTKVANTSLLTCQSSSFIDSSVNQFTITPIGGITTSNVTPLLYNSVYFDGTGDYLTVPNSSTLLFGSGDFTVETWVYPTALAADRWIVGFWSYTAPANQSWALYMSNSTGGYGFVIQGDAGAEDLVILSTSNTVVLNQWTHVAVTRSGSSWRMFINGVQSATGTYSGTLASPSTVLAIAAVENVPQLYVGYISNLRVVKGTAVYTAAFTPNTTPLTAIANTSLLTCQNTYFKDNSNNDFTITPNGNASADIKNPFLNSVFFDGTGDYLTVPDNTSLNTTEVRMGTENFTMEAWIYPMSASQLSIFSKGLGGSTGHAFYMNANQALAYTRDLSSTTTSSNNLIPLNTWSHVAVVREGTGTNQSKLYFNGVSVATFTNPTDFNQTNNFYIGRGRDNSNGVEFNGYISNARIVKGTAVYTANFTPSTTPLTAIANTSLLTCTGGNIKDYSNNNLTLNTTGNAVLNDSNPFVLGTNTLDKTLQFSNGGTITITGSGSSTFNNQVGNDIVIESSNGNATISMTSSSSKMFSGNNATYTPIILNQGGTGTLFITGNNTFEDITATITSTSNTTITLPVNSTTTVNTFSLSGNNISFRYPTLNSNTQGTIANVAGIANVNGIYDTNADYIICRDIAFTPYAVDGTDYVHWFVGANSLSLNNNYGALFQNYDANNFNKVYLIETGNSWTVPSDFNISNNTVHLFGGGGGGSAALTNGSNPRGGPGGGGGGYTKVINYYGYENQQLTLSIGSGGLRGSTSGQTGSAGGNTSITGWYGSHFAYGGRGGGAPAGAGGAGGIGATFNGGAGGNGGPQTGGAAPTTSGGGGGGAGGPLGVGGAGGTGIASTAATSGGGGGGNGGGSAGGAGLVGGGNAGGNNALGFGRGTSTTDAFSGGGAAGGYVLGKTGGDGIDVLNSFGGGGGGSGGGSTASNRSPGGTGGRYGGGGGGGAGDAYAPGFAAGANGSGGVIIIAYTPNTAPKSNREFLLMFEGRTKQYFPAIIDYFVVGGGGSGGSVGNSVGGGGGGAGGLLTGTATLEKGVIYTITIGAGGTGRTTSGSGLQGANSSITGSGTNSNLSVISFGGGGGADSPTTAGNGGSGGGIPGGSGTVGKGIYPGSTYINAPRQGYDGGLGNGTYGSTACRGGGGGGSASVGGAATATLPGAGGSGTTHTLTGSTSIPYAVGGAGGAGSGGGAGASASVNTGNGGAGAGGASLTSGAGGSGIVFISCSVELEATVTGSPTVTINGPLKVYTFTGSGSITF